MSKRRTAQTSAFAKSVFINCPFDREYQTLLRPVLFTVLSLGFVPRIGPSDRIPPRVGLEKSASSFASRSSPFTTSLASNLADATSPE